MTEGSEIFEGRLPRLVREQLAEVVRANGAQILDDPRRVKAMLGDTVATARREISLINVALTEGVAERLEATAGDPLRLRSEIDTLTRQLVTNHAFQADAAAWAVRSCAWALNLAPPPDDLEPGPTSPATFSVEAPVEPERPLLVDPLPEPEPMSTTEPPPAVMTSSASTPEASTERGPVRRSPFFVILGVCLLVPLALVAAFELLSSSSSSSFPSSSPARSSSTTASTTPTARVHTVWASSTPPSPTDQKILNQVAAVFAPAASCRPIADTDADPLDVYPQGPDEGSIECIYPGHGTVVYSLFADDDQMRAFFEGRLNSRGMLHGQGHIGPNPPWELDYTGDASRGSGSIFGYQRPGAYERSEVGFIRNGTHIYAYSYQLGTNYAAYYRWWSSLFKGPAPQA